MFTPSLGVSWKESWELLTALCDSKHFLTDRLMWVHVTEVSINCVVFRLQVSLDKITTDGPVSLISFEDLKMEKERLQGELDRTKKVK